MNIIIIGAGKVGGALAEHLVQEGHRIVAIDNSEKVLVELQNSMDILCLHGNAINCELLIEAGAETAELVIAATDNDITNMLCCLLSKKLGAAHTIARVRGHELSDEIDLFSEDMGLSMTINPELYAAQEIFSLLRFPQLISIESFLNGSFEMIELRLAEEGPATSMTLQELAIKHRSKALVCAIRRDGKTIIPKGSDRLKQGDAICFAAEPDEAERFLALCGIKRRIPKRVMIIGAGQLTFYLIRLLNKVGMRPVVIENNTARAEELNIALPDVLVINANGTNRDILEEEGIDTTDAFISLTGTDEVNALMGVYANRKKVPHVITKVSRNNVVELIGENTAGSIVCPRDIVTSRVISYVRAMESAGDSNVETLYRICERSAEALEFIVNTEHVSLTGIPLYNMSIKEGVLLCAIFRKGSVIIPRGNDTIEPGDHVIIVTSIRGLTDLSMILDLDHTK